LYEKLNTTLAKLIIFCRQSL